MKTQTSSSTRVNLQAIIAVIALLSWSGAKSYSQGIPFADRTSFNAALQSSRTIDFESLPPYDGFGSGQSPIVVSHPVLPITYLTVTNFEHRLFVAGGSSPMNPTPGTGQYIWNFDSSYPIGI